MLCSARLRRIPPRLRAGGLLSLGPASHTTVRRTTRHPWPTPQNIARDEVVGLLADRREHVANTHRWAERNQCGLVLQEALNTSRRFVNVPSSPSCSHRQDDARLDCRPGGARGADHDHRTGAADVRLVDARELLVRDDQHDAGVVRLSGLSLRANPNSSAPRALAARSSAVTVFTLAVALRRPGDAEDAGASGLSHERRADTALRSRASARRARTRAFRSARSQRLGARRPSRSVPCVRAADMRNVHAILRFPR